MYRSIIKPAGDFLLSLLALAVLLPFLLLLSLILVLDDPGPIFFTQKRVGKGKTLFPILKFRTMKVSTPRDCPTHLLQNPEQYITRVGRFLRKTSLDELPQLFNILAGQMSFIGPRPALWNQDDLIAERDKYGANDLRPGLTGLAQIRGRDELPIPVKAKLDGDYAASLSLLTDIKIFFGTFAVVLSHRGVVEGGTGEGGRQEPSDASAEAPTEASTEPISKAQIEPIAEAPTAPIPDAQAEPVDDLQAEPTDDHSL